MSYASDAHPAVNANEVASKPRNFDRAGAVVAFAAVAFVCALLALFATVAVRNSPASAASDPTIAYGP